MDEMGVAVDEARRDPAAIAADGLVGAPARRKVGPRPAKAMRPLRTATAPSSTVPMPVPAKVASRASVRPCRNAPPRLPPACPFDLYVYTISAARDGCPAPAQHQGRSGATARRRGRRATMGGTAERRRSTQARRCCLEAGRAMSASSSATGASRASRRGFRRSRATSGTPSSRPGSRACTATPSSAAWPAWPSAAARRPTPSGRGARSCTVSRSLSRRRRTRPSPLGSTPRCWRRVHPRRRVPLPSTTRPTAGPTTTSARWPSASPPPRVRDRHRPHLASGVLRPRDLWRRAADARASAASSATSISSRA